MVSIQDEIITKLKEHTFTLEVKDVRDTFSTKAPTYPMITIDEVSNRPYIQITGKEYLSNIAYRFEIYTRDTAKDDKVYTKRQISDIIGDELDTLMKDLYGFKRVGDPQRLPYGEDKTILRYIVTYGGKIDNETMILYQ